MLLLWVCLKELRKIGIKVNIQLQICRSFAVIFRPQLIGHYSSMCLIGAYAGQRHLSEFNPEYAAGSMSMQ